MRRDRRAREKTARRRLHPIRMSVSRAKVAMQRLTSYIHGGVSTVRDKAQISVLPRRKRSTPPAHLGKRRSPGLPDASGVEGFAVGDRKKVCGGNNRGARPQKTSCGGWPDVIIATVKLATKTVPFDSRLLEPRWWTFQGTDPMFCYQGCVRLNVFVDLPIV